MKIAIFATNQYLLITAINLKLTLYRNHNVYLYTPFKIRSNIFQKIINITDEDNIETTSSSLSKEMKAAYYDEDYYNELYDFESFDEILTMGYTYFPYWLCSINRKRGSNTKLIRLCDGVVFKYSDINYTFNKSFCELLGNKSLIQSGFNDDYYYGRKIPIIQSGQNQVVYEMDILCGYNEKENKFKDFDYIFFTSSSENNINVILNETEIIKDIANKVGKNKLLIKPHPKRNISDLINCGLEIDTFGWCSEFLYPHVDLSEKIFFSVGTNAVLTPFEMFGIHPKKVVLLDKLFNIRNHEIFCMAYENFMKSYKNIYIQAKTTEEVS